MPTKRLLLLLLLLFSACSGDTSTPTTEAPPLRLLVWRENGMHFNDPSPTESGEIGFLDNSQFSRLLEVPARANHVLVCGPDDGDLFAFYVGAEQGDLYLMSGGAIPQRIGSAARLTCLDRSTFRYAPDQQRLAYIDYGSNDTTGEFIDGHLHVMATGDGRELFQQEGVTAFELDDERLLMMRFFTNSVGQANEATLYLWDGERAREISTLMPDRDCRYTSASITLMTDHALLLMGHRCRDQGTSWQLYRADIADGRLSLLASAAQPGGFLPYTRTNSAYLAPDGQHLFFTVPDGVTSNTVSLLRVDLNSLEVEEVIDRQIVMATAGAASSNAFPQRSPDGRWLAAVITSPNQDNRLALLDLTTGTVSTVNAGTRGDVIPALRFSADSSRVYFLAGQAERGSDTDVSLMVLETSGGAPDRIARGRYAPALTVSPQTGAIALLEYILPENGQQPYLNLVQLNADGEQMAVLDEGAAMIGGRVTDRHFNLPLSWRP
ncbi:MAG: hypothetical protein K8L99_04525 [Anaerolineae bacterium]|nr:hypothetical protein [Anaerolineae bacterium]